MTFKPACLFLSFFLALSSALCPAARAYWDESVAIMPLSARLPGWTPAQLAALRGTELGIKHTGSGGRSSNSGRISLTVFPPPLQNGEDGACFKDVYLHAGENRFWFYKQPPAADYMTYAEDYFARDEYSRVEVIDKAVAEVFPCAEAHPWKPLTTVYVDVLELLRAAPKTPEDVKLVTPKGPLPSVRLDRSGKNARSKRGKDRSAQLLLHIAEQYISPRGKIYYLCWLQDMRPPDDREKRIEIQVNGEVYKLNNAAYGNSGFASSEKFLFLYAVRKGEKQLVIEKIEGVGGSDPPQKRDLMPLLRRNGSKPVTFATKKGPLPPGRVTRYTPPL